MRVKNMSLAFGLMATAILVLPASARAQVVIVDATEPTPTEERQFRTDQDDLIENEWILTGFVGPNFGDDINETNTAIGGTVSYLRNGAFGAEVMANFTPEFDFSPTDLGESALNSYMLNAIAAVPIGEDGWFQPFVSGGVGVLTIHGDTEVDDPADLVEFDDAQAGGNLGAGVMAFRDAWGFRADLRYFDGFDDDSTDPDADPIDLIDPNDLLGDTSFWQFSVGLGYRW